MIMRANDPVLRGAEALDRGAGLVVGHMRAELHRIAAQRLESVAEHQVLGVSIDETPLPGAGDPGRSDLKPMVRCVNVHVARRADEALSVVDDGREGKLRSGGLVRERRPHIGLERLGPRHHGGSLLPQGTIARRGRQGRHIIERSMVSR